MHETNSSEIGKRKRDVTNTIKAVKEGYKKRLEHYLKNNFMNSVTLIGFVGQDAECINEPRMARFSICTEERYQDVNKEWQVRKDWHNVIVWNKPLIETKSIQIRKGHRLIVTGKLRSGSYKDDQGIERKTVQVEATMIEQIVNIR